MIRVKVRSPSPFAQAGLENAIAADPRFEVVGPHEANPDQAADVLLLDDSDSAVASTSSAGASTRIVLLTDGIDPSDFARLSQIGIRAILPRDSLVQEVTAALLAASEDLTVIAPEFLTELLRPPVSGRYHEIDELPEPLTSREREVLALLAEGAGNKDIAARLRISESTAKFHVSAILGKMGATTRTEAVTRGYRLGLILI